MILKLIDFMRKAVLSMLHVSLENNPTLQVGIPLEGAWSFLIEFCFLLKFLISFGTSTEDHLKKKLSSPNQYRSQMEETIHWVMNTEAEMTKIKQTI